MAERTAVLLGAGASRDAGLPLTEELARELVESFDRELSAMDQWARPRQEPVVRALHVTYGAMVSHATEQGASPLTAVNVERLVSAIRLLSGRRDHEAAAFVQAWKPVVEEVDAHPLPLDDSDLRRHIGLDGDFRFEVNGLAQDIASIARATVAPGDGSTFRELEDQLLRRICSLLAGPEDVSYLSPLFELAAEQVGGLDITTLNYDRTVEIAAEQHGIRVDTGMGRWEPGQPLVFEAQNGVVNLIKPHGSIDWARISSTQRQRLEGHPLVQHVYRTGITHSPDPDFDNASRPLIVIGDREKLETDGPTLALMRAFEESLLRASRLLVVGYSFGDKHVNTVVRNWLNADPDRTITIVDPGWPDSPSRSIGWDTHLTLKEALHFTAGLDLTSVPGRVMVVKKGAKAGLSEAVSARPLPKLDKLLMAKVVHNDPVHLIVSNPGYDLFDLVVHVFSEYQQGRSSYVQALRRSPDEDWATEVQIRFLAAGDSFVVYLNTDTGTPTREISVRGSSWAYVANESVNFTFTGSANPSPSSVSSD